MMFLFDTHAHLDQIEDIESALKDAVAAGVKGILAVGVDLASNKKNLQIKTFSTLLNIDLAFGIHPGEIKAEEIDETLAFMRENREEMTAVGEIGLDYWYKGVKKDPQQKALQKDVFVRQLEMAGEFGLPVTIHSRGAWQDCFDLTRAAGLKKAVFHWYSGPVDILDKILEAGFYISATPSLATSPQAREAVSHAPLERILVETDSPVFYRCPGEEGGFRAQPKDVLRTLNFLSELKGRQPQDMHDRLNTNAREVLGMNAGSPPTKGLL